MIKPTLTVKYDGISVYTVEAPYGAIMGLCVLLNAKVRARNPSPHIYALEFHRNRFPEVVSFLDKEGYHCLVM